MAIFNRKIRIKEERDRINVSNDPLSFPPIPNAPRSSESMLPHLPRLPSIRPLESPIRRQQVRDEEVRDEEGRLSLKPKMSMEMPRTEISKGRAKDQIFVKIDKYNDAMANFEIVKKKLMETSSLLENIRETRKREGEELNLWASELESIKSKISLIDKKIFNSLD